LQGIEQDFGDFMAADYGSVELNVFAKTKTDNYKKQNNINRRFHGGGLRVCRLNVFAKTKQE